MESSSKAKAAAGLVAVFAVGVSVVLAARTEPETAVSTAEIAEPAAQPVAEAPARLALAEPPPASPGPAAAARVVNQVVPASARVAAEPAFDSPECPDFSFVSSQTQTGSATVRHGDSEPEEVKLGSLLEAGEVIHVGTHPTSGANTVVVRNADGTQCQVTEQKPVAQAPANASLMGAWRTRVAPREAPRAARPALPREGTLRLANPLSAETLKNLRK